MSPGFSKAEIERYSRHIIIPEFNVRGQERLKAGSVLVIGSGGLGSPLLLYLAAAGVGRIGIVDFDVVDDSNLQRQVLFDVHDVGKPKAMTAAKKIKALNPHIEVEVFDTRLDPSNALDLVSKFDIVADGSDNFQTRYLVNDACVLSGKSVVYGSVFRFDGQVSVFNYLHADGSRGPNYRDLHPLPPPPGSVPSCAEGGVLGVLPGIIGSLQANEAIKLLSGIGEPLSGKIFVFDALRFESRILKISRDPANPLTGTHPVQKGLINYEEFCGLPNGSAGTAIGIREISPLELAEWRKSGKEFQLIDVRELYEYEIANLGGELIPVSTVLSKYELISREGDVVVYCRTGVRSAKAIGELQKNFGFNNLFNLRGGILAYADEVDKSIPKY